MFINNMLAKRSKYFSNKKNCEENCWCILVSQLAQLPPPIHVFPSATDMDCVCTSLSAQTVTFPRIEKHTNIIFSSHRVEFSNCHKCQILSNDFRTFARTPNSKRSIQNIHVLRVRSLLFMFQDDIDVLKKKDVYLAALVVY